MNIQELQEAEALIKDAWRKGWEARGVIVERGQSDLNDVQLDINWRIKNGVATPVVTWKAIQ